MKKAFLFLVASFVSLATIAQNTNKDKSSFQAEDLLLASSAMKGGASLERLRDQQLAKYSISFDTVEDKALGLLIGNAEMGGIVPWDGLGVERVYRADLWKTSENRLPLFAVRVEPKFDAGSNLPEIEKYKQTLDLVKGVVNTHVEYSKNKGGYDAKVFFMNDPKQKNLLIIHVVPFGAAKEFDWTTKLPVEFASDPDRKRWGAFQYIFQKDDHDLFETTQPSLNRVSATVKPGMLGAIPPFGQNWHYFDKDGYTVTSPYDKPFTQLGNEYSEPRWEVVCNRSMKRIDGRGRYNLEKGKDGITLVFAATSINWSEFTKEELSILENPLSFDKLLTKHTDAWKNDWQKTPVIITPDERQNQLFYRCLFWTLCQAGSKKFLPGEAQFAAECWGMTPFTYGNAGFSIHALFRMGHKERAEKLIQNFLKPDALKYNAKVILGKETSDAMCFPHMFDLGLHMDWPCGTQQHLTGFAVAMLQLPFIYEKNSAKMQQYEKEYFYPIAKGCAEFWMKLDTKWEKDKNGKEGLVYRPMLSVSEDIARPSVLDLVLAAKWGLNTAADCADKLNRDADLARRWRDQAQKLLLSERQTDNGSIYAEYFGDTGRKGGGYNGVRAPIYLGWPTDFSNTLNRETSLRTLDNAFICNDKGIGTITFVSNWFSIAEARFCRGDRALAWLENNFFAMDKRTNSIYEIGNAKNNPYFGTNQSSYLVAIAEMMTQTNGKTCKIFPAVPSSWKNIVLLNMPTGAGKRLSAIMKDGLISYLIVDGKQIKSLTPNSIITLK